MSSASTSSRPAIRAIQPQNLLNALEHALSADEWTALSARLDTDAVEGIRSQLMLSWVPLDIHMPLSETVMEFVGRERFVELFERTYAQSLSSPMLGSLFGALRRLSGGAVHTVFKHTPRMYRYVARGSGKVNYRRDGERAVVLDLVGWPSEYSAECWGFGAQGCLQALLSATTTQDHGPSSVEITEIDGRAGRMSYRLTWV